MKRAIVFCLVVVVAGFAGAAASYIFNRPSTSVPATPADVTAPSSPTSLSLKDAAKTAPVVHKHKQKNRQAAALPSPETKVSPQLTSTSAPEIDPLLLEQAEMDLLRHQAYEQQAMETLPTVTVQTHNPVWQLEYAAAHTQRGEKTQVEKARALPTPESGPYGNIQPPEGEIWLRIPAENAAEHQAIMEANAELYRTETGYTEPVTVTLWVGGKPFVRKTYE